MIYKIKLNYNFTNTIIVKVNRKGVNNDCMYFQSSESIHFDKNFVEKKKVFQTLLV